jgi:hypothetical protein
VVALPLVKSLAHSKSVKAVISPFRAELLKVSFDPAFDAHLFGDPFKERD